LFAPHKGGVSPDEGVPPDRLKPGVSPGGDEERTTPGPYSPGLVKTRRWPFRADYEAIR